MNLLHRRAFTLRALAAFLAATLLLVALAVFAVRSRNAATDTSETTGPLFVGLRNDLNAVSRISISTEGGADVILARQDDGSWIVESLDRYPADAREVKSLLMGLASLEFEQRLTANPEKHAAVGLTDNTATRVRLWTAPSSTNDSPTRVDLLLTSQQSDSRSKCIRLFGDDQVWRVRGDATAPTTSREFIDRELLVLPDDSLLGATYDGLEITRHVHAEDDHDADHHIQESPWEVTIHGPVIWTPENANKAKQFIVSFLARLDFEEVRAIPTDTDCPVRPSLEYFVHGAHLSITPISLDGATWIRISGTVDSATDQSTPDAIDWATFLAKIDGWEYKLPQWKSDALAALNSESH
ncbi:MAG: DUF4340 domain-containing protein [Planctomycetota bacterium]|nr:DUF4340 domain-containing protein [Planctomycetota bacterium]